MSHVVKISEAASLAMHTMAWLASNPEKRPSTRQIAKTFNVSQNHLAKVLQRLVRAGMVRSARGPKGGFSLGVRADRTTLLDVYDTIEGPLENVVCLLGTPVCKNGNCIFGQHLDEISKQVREMLAGKRLSELSDSLKEVCDHEAEDNQN